jgi:hypothetical protein
MFQEMRSRGITGEIKKFDEAEQEDCIPLRRLKGQPFHFPRAGNQAEGNRTAANGFKEN